VRLKVLDTETALQIAAEIGYLPMDQNIASFLGVPGLGATGNQPSGATNRGFNRPLNSNEQYNSPETVAAECETKNTGDYCFENKTTVKLRVHVGTDQRGELNGSDILLDPGQSQCFYSLKAQSFYYKIYRARDGSNPPYFYDTKYIIGKGTVLIEKCKSKTFVIK
jgi:hypothetical protein